MAAPTPKQRRILVSAGDPSGDLILARVVAELKQLDPQLQFEGLCGPASAAQGVRMLAEARDVAVVGIAEVLSALPRILKTLKGLQDQLMAPQRPHALLCLDFPDFNFKVAQVAKRQGVKAYYVVPPQLWAWRSERVHTIRSLFTKVYPALPFEEAFYRERGVAADWLGHPMRDVLPPRDRRGARADFALGSHDFALALLPGSRRGELKRHLPLFLEAWETLKRENGRSLALRALRPRGLLPLAPGWDADGVRALLKGRDRARWDGALASGEWTLCPGQAHRVLMACDFGWVASGTATLEAAYYQLPHLLVYRLNPLSAFLIRRMTDYFDVRQGMAGLPNILLQRPCIPELLQSHLNATRLVAETLELWSDQPRLTKMRKELRFFPKRLGEAGSAERIARDLLKLWETA